jgi:Ni/Fe-hydrogenase subunit HybB-like protein
MALCLEFWLLTLLVLVPVILLVLHLRRRRLVLVLAAITTICGKKCLTHNWHTKQQSYFANDNDLPPPVHLFASLSWIKCRIT